MTSSVPSTPRNTFKYNHQTPMSAKMCRRSLIAHETPNGTPISIETPSRIKRRGSKEKFSEISNVLTVAVRVRPMNSKELNCISVYDSISVDNNEIIVKILPTGNITVGHNHSFQYDHVFYTTNVEKTDFISQEEVFLAIGKPLLENAFKGYNACLFAYGQTGSGKSYSMMGDNIYLDMRNNFSAGIIPRFCFDIFDTISQLPKSTSVTFEISYYEIYNEKIYDLLINPCPSLDKRTPLKVREHPDWGPYVVNLSAHSVKSFSEVMDLLQIGNKFRATAATIMNEKSSRSHSIVSIELSICELDSNGMDSSRRSKINLVDLAGSERVGNSCSHDDRHREGVSINQSLLTLGKVISSLADSKRTHTFIPYRDSTLTWLLRESLGGNSLTSMLATITPASSHIDETLATLRYACQARSIVNRAYINENPHDRLIRELRAEVERLRALRQDYEKQSSFSTPMQNTSSVSETSMQEMDELRQRLTETERSLEEAQKAWTQRFFETKQKQLQELEEAEKKKAELESHVRIMSTINQTVHVSPYKSNFLKELEGVLEESKKENLPKSEPINSEDKNKSFSKLAINKHWQQISKASKSLKPMIVDDEHLFHAYLQLENAINLFDNALNKSKFRTRSNKTVKFQL